MTTFTINVEPIGVDVVVLPRARYDELCATEAKAAAAPKPNPLFTDEQKRLLTGQSNPVVPPEAQYPRQVRPIWPYVLDTAYRARAGSIAPVDARYLDLEQRYRALREQKDSAEANARAARRDLESARNDLALSRIKHAKATKHIAEYKRRVSEYERDAVKRRDELRDALRRAADHHQAAAAARQKVANTANIEITLRENAQPVVALHYDGEILTGVLNRGELHPASVHAGYMLAANGFPGRISAPVSLRISSASNVRVKR
ncbi:Uncharacterised protein [Mycobacteroides abscessus subsp. abscessus]|nr:Uncharacterised protein [Mycobacteroides abscessus subsp. abscessus]